MRIRFGLLRWLVEVVWLVGGRDAAERVAGRSAELSEALWDRRAVPGLPVPGALAGGISLFGLRPRARLGAQGAPDRRMRGLRQTAFAARGHDLRADQDRAVAVVPGDLPGDLEQGWDLGDGAQAADGLRELPDRLELAAQDQKGDGAAG